MQSSVACLHKRFERGTWFVWQALLAHAVSVLDTIIAGEARAAASAVGASQQQPPMRRYLGPGARFASCHVREPGGEACCCQPVPCKGEAACSAACPRAAVCL